MTISFKSFYRLSPATKILLSFVLVAIIGNFILALPILQKPSGDESRKFRIK